MTDPLFLTLDEVLGIHADQIRRYGGRPGLRDLGLLRSALALPETTFDGEFLHPSLFEMAATFGAKRLQVWRHILLPGALPAIMAGIRIGLARAIHGMVAVELLLMAVGIGRLILKYQADFDPDLLFATVLVVIGEAVLLIEVAKRIEQRAIRWTEPITVD